MSTSRESDKFIVRLPDGMRDRIKVAADANGRSMNAEIVATLREAYPAPIENSDIIELFEALPKEAQEEFLHRYLSKIPIQDIEDGLIPGARTVKKLIEDETDDTPAAIKAKE